MFATLAFFMMAAFLHEGGVLNMLSTATMVRMGKTFGNLMVDLKPWNAKLRDRSTRILSTLANLGIAEAERTLENCEGDLKTALVVELCDVDIASARDLLQENSGMVKAAVRHRTRSEA